MRIPSLAKLLKYFPYYLEIFAKRLNAKGEMNPHKNGEYFILRRSLLGSGSEIFVYIDGGANVGDNVMYLNSLGKATSRKINIFAVEPAPVTFAKLSENVADTGAVLLNAALGDSMGCLDFYVDSNSATSGGNSALPHYYLNDSKKISVDQTTIDEIVRTYGLSRVNFLKLDVEGFELLALNGARASFELGLIDYVQLEYNQTWIPAKISLKDVFDFFAPYDYSIYRIAPRGLLGITAYHYTIDDFYFSNLLIARNASPLPGRLIREISPLIDSRYAVQA